MKADVNNARIAIFASGGGSNAEQIIRYFRDHPFITVNLIVCNRPGAGVIAVGERAGIEVLMIEKKRFMEDGYLPELLSRKIGFVALAGFLWKVPLPLIEAYPRAMTNIHPALLPAFGGPGMYGERVHEAVIRSGEPDSGITIHFVNEHYDKGDIIFQKDLRINPTDTAKTLAERVLQLEHYHYPRVIERAIQINTGIPPEPMLYAFE